MEEDFIFRYNLTAGDGEAPCHDRLVWMLREQLCNLLQVVAPLQDGREVRVDGFKLLNDPDTQYALQEEESPATAAGPTSLSEPRIDLIKRQLESILRVVRLERNGEVVEPDAFRLKDLRDWLAPSACDPSEVFSGAATKCNSDCIFCYNKGNPPQLALGGAKETPHQEFHAIQTRVKYFSPRAKQSLLPAPGSMYELMAHPHGLETLRLLRQKTARPFRITTNGLRLTPDVIDALGELKPVYLYISLNSASPERHRRLMRSGSVDVPLAALPLLREKGIPYAVVVVAWVLDSLKETLDDLASTVAACEPFEPHLFQVNLPGYSRFFSDRRLFDLDEVWTGVVHRVRELRKTVVTPIVAMPTLYEENLCEERKNLPVILGLVRNSPAARSGLEQGDGILEVNGLPVNIRPQARDFLSAMRQTGGARVKVAIERCGQRRSILLDSGDSAYPYSAELDPHFGIVFRGMGFRTSYIEKLREIVDSHKARRVLFLSSRLVKPVFEQTLQECHILGGISLDIRVPENRFFGGNIFMGDLLVVSDFIQCIREYVAENPKPDIVIIPSSPFHASPWRRDLTGRSYRDIERETGVPVELLEHEPMTE